MSNRLMVESKDEGSRLDAFLARHGLAPSASAARRAIAQGIVRVDGGRAPKGLRLVAGQSVELTAAFEARPRPVAENIPLEILHVDDSLVAVNKPGGMASHPLRSGEAPSAASAILARFPECAAASPDPREGGLVHRLDRGTTGVLVAARSASVWPRLREALAAPECQKTYLVEVVGQFPNMHPGERDFVSVSSKPRTLQVAVPIGRSGRRGQRVRLGSGRQPLPALTEVTLVEQRATTALVEARLAKGRTHQVRAHLAYLGIPVVGDSTYGEGEDEQAAAAEPGALHLHAASLVFRHPVTGEIVHITAPVPAWGQPGSRARER